MIESLIRWAINSRFVVILLALALLAFGMYSFLNVDVEAYPDPAPAIVEIIAQFPGASAEEVERQITIPMEIALAGMPSLDTMRSQSMFQLGDLRCQFEYSFELKDARQEVLNRLTEVNLPTEWCLSYLQNRRPVKYYGSRSIRRKMQTVTRSTR